MKIIDIFNKIANGEEVPLNIKCGCFNYKYDFEKYDYKTITGAGIEYLFEYYFKVLKTKIFLDLDIEIIEEDKKLKKLDFCEENTFSNMKECTYLSPKERRLLDSNFKELGNIINELIDEVNKLKGENE